MHKRRLPIPECSGFPCTPINFFIRYYQKSTNAIGEIRKLPSKVDDYINTTKYKFTSDQRETVLIDSFYCFHLYVYPCCLRVWYKSKLKSKFVLCVLIYATTTVKIIIYPQCTLCSTFVNFYSLFCYIFYLTVWNKLCSLTLMIWSFKK